MRKQKDLIVILVGPIGDIKKPPPGGYQACNRRTMSCIRDNDIKIKSIAYPESSANIIMKIPFYIFSYILIMIRLIFLPKCIVHITALYKHFIYIEFILSLIVKIKGNIVIYDIRAGSFINYYHKFSKLYRFFCELNLKFADKVMIEGKEYEKFVENITGLKPFYFPNHVSIPESDKNYRARYNGYSMKEIHIVYAGRIESNKGIDIILQASEKLLQRGYDLRTTIAGCGNDKYVNELKSKYDKLKVQWLGNQTPLEVMNLFQKGHFFIFPTSHSGEGHSNALTEAMASGCVPVASDNGFNSSIISDCGIVLRKGHGAQDYANAVEEIIVNHSWNIYSEKCINRIRNRFETTIVINSLIQEYNQIWGYI